MNEKTARVMDRAEDYLKTWERT